MIEGMLFILVLFLLGIIFSLLAFKKDTKKSKNDFPKCKVHVKIVYDNIRSLYFVYYNGRCVKAEQTLQDAKNWSEENISNYLKGKEIKYEKLYE